MVDETPRPGSREEAEARRNKGAGPFSVAKQPHHRNALCGLECLAVLDAAGATFGWVVVSSAIGGDKASAKARATRIAEALNRADGASALEREAAVAWLRQTAETAKAMWPGDENTRLREHVVSTLLVNADAISRGDHRKEARDAE